jgi:2-dehydropantoate 2-reductase
MGTGAGSARPGKFAMRFTIVGAGAIGGTVGAYMARAGDLVEFVDTRRDHVDAMKRRGLELRSVSETFIVPVAASHPEELSGPLGVVLLAVKAHHTEAAVRSIAPHLGQETAIVSLQNGLCEHIIAGIVGRERTIGAFVNYGADYVEPGVLSYAGKGAFFVGELDNTLSARVAEIVGHLSHWGEVKATANIWGFLWTKIAFMNMLYATAVTGEKVHDVYDRKRALLVELACEVIDVARLEGVAHLESFDNIEPNLYHPRERQDWDAINRSLDGYIARMRGRPRQRTGIWRDLAVHRRKTEVDFHLGMAVEIGARYDLQMPLTRALVDMIHEIEDGRREMSWSNLSMLEQPPGRLQ